MKSRRITLQETSRRHALRVVASAKASAPTILSVGPFAAPSAVLPAVALAEAGALAKAEAPVQTSLLRSLNARLLTLNYQPACFQTLTHSFAPSRKLTPVFSYTYTLFCILPERQLLRLQAVPNSLAKTPGWGYPSFAFCFPPSAFCFTSVQPLTRPRPAWDGSSPQLLAHPCELTHGSAILCPAASRRDSRV